LYYAQKEGELYLMFDCKWRVEEKGKSNSSIDVNQKYLMQ